MADRILALDPNNPQVASRMTTAFKSWRMLESGRRARAKAALQRIADTPKLSRDVHDIAQRALADS
jgi:aminopeptidase N